MDLQEPHSKKVAHWLMLGVIMTIIQIALGGITRLTGSGLSITQWDVITGTLPPLNAEQWQILFTKYQATPQFQLLNFDFTLSNFKFIFFWEWVHRLWARSIGLVFAFGFIYFFVKKYFQPNMIKPLVVLFLLGALQGAIGWIMVASGLEGDAVYVKPTRLALHFIFAIGLLGYTYWFALGLKIKPTAPLNNEMSSTQKSLLNKRIHRIRFVGWILILILFFQFMYGALMAGHKAAPVASTWPTINGAWIPEHLIGPGSFFVNAIDNTIWIHFIHRGLAYILILLILFWTVELFKIKGNGFCLRIKCLPIILVIFQAVLGILSLGLSQKIIPGVWGSFEWFAQIHQLVGMLLFLSIIQVLFLTQKK